MVVPGWVRLVNEVSGTVFEEEITADLPVNTQFLSPRLFMNDGEQRRRSLTSALGSTSGRTVDLTAYLQGQLECDGESAI